MTRFSPSRAAARTLPALTLLAVALGTQVAAGPDAAKQPEAIDLLRDADRARGAAVEGITWDADVETQEDGSKNVVHYLIKVKGDDALAEATQRRIAEGIRRYVLTAAHPFVVNLSHGGHLESLDQPIRTITATPKGGDRAVVVPTLITTGNGEREGQAPRTRDIQRPLGTVTAQGSQGAVVAAWLAKHYGGVVGHGLERPLGTITSTDHHSLVSVELDRSTTDRSSRVAAFLLKYYGTGGQWSELDEPMHTIVAKARMGLVTVQIDGDEYALVDIGMRMLAPRELARAQGFPDDYVLTGSKANQIARIGNSVSPPHAEAHVRAALGLA
jgi:DNA (cytosine-5)-methyltransferase 1